MTSPVIVDTNLLVLLIVGSASRSYIAAHKRLKGFGEDDFDLLRELVADFSVILTLPHILAEASGLIRHFRQAALPDLQSTFSAFIDACTELPVASLAGSAHSSFIRLGLTDAVILHACSLTVAGVRPTLLTTDTVLADNALSLGYSVIDYRRDFQTA